MSNRSIELEATLRLALEGYMAAYGQALEAHGIELQQQQIEADRCAREALAQPIIESYPEKDNSQPAVTESHKQEPCLSPCGDIKCAAICKRHAEHPEQNADRFCDANCVWTDHHPDCKFTQPAVAEQHEQEPVASVFLVNLYNFGYKAGHHDTVEGRYIDICRQDMDTYHSEDVSEWLEDMGYTAPPPVGFAVMQKPWVGLTPEEADELYKQYVPTQIRRLMWAIETKLREKNSL